MRIVVALLGVPLLGCGSSEPADVAGNYSIALTNRDNGCNLANWTVGEQATGIPVVIMQEGSTATADVQAGAGFILDAALGSSIYTGDVDGNDLFLELFGNRPQQQGNCSFTFNSEIDASLAGDALSGRINYKAATNDNPDCTALEGCVSFQEFNGTRPPE
jgi:hypothetical protein